MSKAYRNDWAQQRARESLKRMRGEGMSPQKIGEQLGFSGEMIRRFLDPSNPSLITERLFNALVEAKQLDPSPPDPTPTNQLEAGVAPGSRTEELLARILRAQEEQALLIKTLTELVIARKGE